MTGIHLYNLHYYTNIIEVICYNLVQMSDGLATVLETMVRVHFNRRYNLAKEAVKTLINPVQVTINPFHLQRLFKFIPQRQKSMNLPQ